MYLAMTVGTILRSNKTSIGARDAVEIKHLARMGVATAANLRMAGLAKLRTLLDQHCRVIRSMHLVAQCAFLCGRRVFPQEWATFLGMT